MLCDAVDPGEIAIFSVVAFERSPLTRLKGHGGKISPILASAPSTSPFVCPTLAISGNTAEGKQKVHAALDASGSNIAGFLVDEHTSFPPPLDSNSASPQDLVTSFNNAMSNIPGLPQLSALSPSVHHPEIEGEQQTSQNAHPLDSMSPIATTGKNKTFLILRNEIHKIDEMSEKGTFRRILENDADKNAISASFKRVDEAMKTFQLDIAWTTERKMDDIHSEIELAKLDRLLAHKAIYDADLGGRASVTREPCTAGTREEILQDIIAWVDDTSADSPPVFWLTGQAGSGKTTIAYTVTQYFDELEETEHTGQRTLLAASFHCSRQFDETRRQIHIIPTIVYQLARKSRSYAKALHAAKKLDSVDKLTKQMEDLLAGPWQQSESQRHKELPPYLIVVDALDEIEADGGSMFLQSLLETINQRRLQGLKFLVTSRPDPRVAKLCETFSSEAVYRLQDVPIERVELDIIKFLKIKLSNFTDNAELEAMAVLADGLFISAATIVRYLTPDPSIELEEQRELLRKLRDGKTFAANGVLLIDELYQQILRDAFSGFTGDLFKSRRSILHTFLCTIERTTTSVAAALLSKPDAIADAVLKKLHAVLYSKDGQVFWYHASFPDFIFSETRSTFEFDGRKFSMSCNVARHHALLTESCFDIMRKSLRFNIGDIPSSFLLDAEDAKLKQRVDTNIKPFLIYASRHWSHHLAQTNQKNGEDLGSCITDFLRIRILFWIEAMNLLGFSSHCSTMLQYAREWILKNTNRESELPNNLAEAANFATYFATNLPALSTPHLYISALATWSTGSAISQQWKETFPDVPTFIHRQADVPLMTIPTGTFAAFSPDGTCIVSGTGRKDYSVRVWDVSTAAELKVLNGHKDIVWCVAFSLDGTRIVSGSKDTSVRVWDVSTAGELKVLHGHTKDTSVRVWDVSTGAELKVLDGHTRIVYSVAFSLDGTRIVSGSKDRSVRVWDASTAAELKVLHGHTMGVRSIAFSPDGAHIVSGSDDTSVRVWDVSTGAELKVLDGHTMIVYSVAFSPDGTRIVSGSLDTSVRVWDTSTGTELRVLDGYTEYINSVAYSPDGTRIVSGSCQTPVRIWDASTGAKAKVKVHHGHKDNVKSVAFSTDGTRIVSGSDDKSVRVWDASTGAELKVLYGHTQGVNSIAFSPDGAHIVSGSKDMSVRVWDVSTGAELKVLNGHKDISRSVTFSPDGTRIVSGSNDKSVRVWDVPTGVELMVLNGHSNCVNCVAYSSDGTRIVSGSWDKSGRVWDASAGAELSVRVWDASTGADLRVLNGHTEGVNSVAFSPDGTLIVSGSWDRSVRVWDVLTGAELKVYIGHQDAVKSVAFSTDGFRIISGSKDKSDTSVQLWDASTGAELKVLKGHTESVNSVAYSPGGTHIVSSSKDKSVRVWDASTGAELMLRVLNGHTKGVNSVAFSPDGTRIVSGSKDMSVRVWDVSTSLIDSSDVAAQDEESARLSIVSHKYPAWTTDPNQWVFSVRGGYRLMWVPETVYPFSIITISRHGSTSINFRDCKIGRDWANCYAHS
ncbi:mycorrhiza-induced NACHT/WD-repeat protein [Crassisporium funariophilum]|nr:mycorrhiza-induced NACHT/WD-repeat protein [Crassisporium funariophilum]